MQIHAERNTILDRNAYTHSDDRLLCDTRITVSRNFLSKIVGCNYRFVRIFQQIFEMRSTRA